MLNRIRYFLSLPLAEKALLARLAVLLPLAGLALWGLDFKRTYRLVERFSSSCRLKPNPDEQAFVMARRMGYLVNAAARHGLYKAGCLRRSLVLWALLRRRGLPVELRIGTRLLDGKFQAHAWVELAGRAVNESDSDLSGYAAYESIHGHLQD